MEDITCKTCCVAKPAEQFYKHPTKKTGRYSDCIPCHRTKYITGYFNKNKSAVSATQRNRRTKIRAEVSAYKAKRGCNQCSETRPWCLAFHHPNDDKEANVGSLNGYSRKRVFAEIEKCVVLCHNCHADEHHRCGSAGQIRTDIFGL